MLGPYRGALRELLLRAKFHGDAASLHGLGTLLAPLALSFPPAHALVPMPLHPARLRERGFNQCQELCRPVAAALDIPLAPDLLVREVNTAHQRGLNATARRQNLRGAFAASPQVDGMRLILVDDVCTTGTTLRQAVQTLLRAGAVVDVLVAGRA